MANLLMKMPLPYEPKKKNRFIIRFPSSLGINEWFISTAQRPKVTITEVEIPFLNTSTYVAGRFNWEPINIKLRDPIGPSASQAIMEWIRLCAESVTGRMGYAAGYMKDIELEMLDPVGVTVEKWVLQEAWLTSSDFGTLDYSDGGLAEIDITIRYARAIQIY